MRVLGVVASALLLMACGGDADPSSSAAASESTGEAGSSLPVLEGDDVWSVDLENSSVSFTAIQEGNAFDGHFNAFEVAIKLNPDDPTDAEIHAIINMTSVDAGDGDRNGSLPTSDWFATKKFPTARFHSTEVIATGGGAFSATGELSIKGAAKLITLPFTLMLDGEKARALGEVEINRTDYNVGEGEFAGDEWVGHGVTVKVDISATKG